MPKMMKSNWLALRGASQQLGVNPATLRQWADQGKVRMIRTPGGHRRFSESDIRSLMPESTYTNSPRRVEMLVQSVVGRARLEIASGRLDRESWYRRFDATAKKQQRELGHQLMRLLSKAFNDQMPDGNLVRQARKLGEQYGETNRAQQVPLPDALRAFLFFRDYIFENLIELFSEQERSLDAYRRLSGIVNEMLVAMVETYSSAEAK